MCYIITIFIMLFSSCVYAQGLTVSPVDGLYQNTDLSSVIKTNQAYLLYSYEPSGSISVTSIFTYNDIKSGRAKINWSKYTGNTSFGRVTRPVDNVVSVISIIDAQHIYTSNPVNSQFVNYGLSSLNEQLSARGLGSPDARQRFLSTLNGIVTLNPPDFRNYLGDWIYIAIILLIILPAWFIFKRFLRA